SGTGSSVKRRIVRAVAIVSMTTSASPRAGRSSAAPTSTTARRSLEGAGQALGGGEAPLTGGADGAAGDPPAVGRPDEVVEVAAPGLGLRAVPALVPGVDVAARRRPVAVDGDPDVRDVVAGRPVGGEGAVAVEGAQRLGAGDRPPEPVVEGGVGGEQSDDAVEVGGVDELGV